MLRTIYTDAQGRQRVQRGTDPLTLAIRPLRRPRRVVPPIRPLVDELAASLAADPAPIQPRAGLDAREGVAGLLRGLLGWQEVAA
jgi:hypothetical protein